MSKVKDFTDSQAIQDLVVSKGWELVVQELNTRIANLSSLLDNPENFTHKSYLAWLVEKSQCMKLLELPETLIIDKAPKPKQEGVDPY